MRSGRGAVLVSLVIALVCAPAAHAGGPLRTAVFDPHTFARADVADLAMERVRRTGATAVRIVLPWRAVAPAVRPAVFNPADPYDPAYRWWNIDMQVRHAVARGLSPIFIVNATPDWAASAAGGLRPGALVPDPTQLALFMRAAALRYDGGFDPDLGGSLPPLPEVRFWEAWNEPNLSVFFWPQRDASGNALAPPLYRNLVNVFATAVHAVDARNVVVAGALAPFGAPDGHMALDFMRKMLCIGGSPPRAVCSTPVQFDAWSHHPYTMGGPSHSAHWPDDVSIGDLPEMRRILQAAVRAGHVVGATGARKTSVPLWVTEFSWETRSPDPGGLPPRVHARWTAEGLYRMWKSGVSLVTWFLLRDRPYPATPTQSGFFYCGGRTLADEATCGSGEIAGDAAKARTLKAFRFPFVAFPRSGRLFFWGRTPGGKPARVRVDAKIAGRWRAIATLRTNRYGIFSRTVRASVAGRPVRARLLGRRQSSVPFLAARTRDIPLAHPFGCGGGLPC